MYSDSQETQTKPQPCEDSEPNLEELRHVARDKAEGPDGAEPIKGAANSLPDTEGPLRDELTRLRSDLHDAWQRLESLELLLGQVSDDSAPQSATPTEPLKLEEAATPDSEEDDTESVARQDAHDPREICPESHAETPRDVAETRETASATDIPAPHVGDLDPSDAIEPSGLSEDVADETDDTDVDNATTADELAIREYMERLLQRVGGGSMTRDESAAAEPSRDDRNLADQETLEDGPSFPAASDERQDDCPPADGESSLDDASIDPTPRDEGSEADEIPEDLTRHDEDSREETDLRAMRALANVAAKTVIIEFESKQHAKLAMDKLLVMLVCLPCGMLLLYWYSVHRLGVAYIAASIAFFAVAIWGAQALRFLAKLTVARWSLARLWRDPVTRD